MSERDIDTQLLKERLGRVGLWNAGLSQLGVSELRERVQEIEELGFTSLWVNEPPREVLTYAGLVLASSSRLTVASGIASIWAREPETLVKGSEQLAEAYGDRFVVGIGVGHAKFQPRYSKPLEAARAYLERMHTASSGSVPWLLAALRPKMLELAADLTQGTHPYFVPVEHTAVARAVLGDRAVVAPELAVVLDSDPGAARRTARKYMRLYLGLPNYVNNLLVLGFTEEDMAHGGSDRLVDAVVAWGDLAAIRRRVDEHIDAGADHVAVQPISETSGYAAREVAELANALLS